MTRFIRLSAAVICIAILLSGCGMVSVNENRFNAQVVATVGSEDITVAEYTEYVNMYATYYGISLTNPDQADYAQQIKEAALLALVDEKVKVNKAKEMGYADLTEEEKSAIDKEIEEWVQVQRRLIIEQNEISEDDEEFIQSELMGYFRSMGLVDLDQLYRERYRDAGLDKLFSYMTADASADDDQVRAYYDQTLSEQKAAFDANPSEYETALANDVTPLLYVPDGFRHVKHILLKVPDEISNELNALMSAGDAAYETKLAEALAPLHPQATEVLAKVEAGEDFDSLIEEFGQDPGMTQEPYMTEGYMVCSTSSMIPEFLEASMMLANPGDVTNLVGGMYGYHIIKLIDIVPSSTVEYSDELKEELREAVFTQSQRDLYNAQMEIWREEYEVKRNESVLKDF